MIESERKAVETSPVEKAILSSGVTPRALLIGTALSVLLAFLAICQEALGGGLSADGYGSGALFLLFALILGVGLLKRIKAVRSGPSPQELLVVFSMLLMVSAIPINGTLMYLIPNMVGFTHYATPENDWGSQVLPLLPDGLSIKDPIVAKGFFEGLGPDGEPPYGAWIWPFFAWAVLLGAFYFTMISLMVIFRKRWIEEERLPFPMAQVPLALVEGEAGGRPLLRNTAFWAGFFLSGVERLSSIVHVFIPAIRPINLRFYTYSRSSGIAVFGFTNFIAIGISYLVSLEVLGSILLFTLLTLRPDVSADALQRPSSRHTAKTTSRHLRGSASGGIGGAGRSGGGHALRGASSSEGCVPKGVRAGPGRGRRGRDALLPDCGDRVDRVHRIHRLLALDDGNLDMGDTPLSGVDAGDLSGRDANPGRVRCRDAGPDEPDAGDSSPCGHTDAGWFHESGILPGAIVGLSRRRPLWASQWAARHGERFHGIEADPSKRGEYPSPFLRLFPRPSGGRCNGRRLVSPLCLLPWGLWVCQQRFCYQDSVLPSQLLRRRHHGPVRGKAGSPHLDEHRDIVDGIADPCQEAVLLVAHSPGRIPHRHDLPVVLV